jgi:hypothetical protein
MPIENFIEVLLEEYCNEPHEAIGCTEPKLEIGSVFYEATSQAMCIGPWYKLHGAVSICGTLELDSKQLTAPENKRLTGPEFIFDIQLADRIIKDAILIDWQETECGYTCTFAAKSVLRIKEIQCEDDTRKERP